MLFDRSPFAHGDALQVTAARERFGHEAVRAQLDLPDFFENLAGNHAGEKNFIGSKPNRKNASRHKSHFNKSD